MSTRRNPYGHRNRREEQASANEPISIRPGDDVPPVPRIPSKHLDSFPKPPQGVSSYTSRIGTSKGGQSRPQDGEEEADKSSPRLANRQGSGSGEWVNLSNSMTASRESLLRNSPALRNGSWEVLPTPRHVSDASTNRNATGSTGRLSLFPDTSSNIPGNPGYKPSKRSRQYRPDQRPQEESSKGIFSRIFTKK